MSSELMEIILSRENMNHAIKRVKSNKGSHGVDGLSIDETIEYLKQHSMEIGRKLREGSYRPQPVRRVEIPKPDGGIRLLGIPTVTDRIIQQAITQVLSPIFEKGFSDSSYGFRPGRCAKQAVQKAREHIEAGNKWVVDIDLEKFFDRVNHDILMSRVARKIDDKRVLKLIRLYLTSGVMINGVVTVTEEGTPQGGNLSPLLSNIMLDDLDKELEKRGHRFCRYADDCNIYVKCRRSGERVLKSISRFIEEKLKLKINTSKSACDIPSRRKFLGFTFYFKKDGKIGIAVHEKSKKRLKSSLKFSTSRSRGASIYKVCDELRSKINGWIRYFSIADMSNFCIEMDEWLRRRIRMYLWKQWKKIRCRHDNLVKLGAKDTKAWEWANTRKGYWHISNSPILNTTLTNHVLARLGVTSLKGCYKQIVSC